MRAFLAVPPASPRRLLRLMVIGMLAAWLLPMPWYRAVEAEPEPAQLGPAAISWVERTR